MWPIGNGVSSRSRWRTAGLCLGAALLIGALIGCGPSGPREYVHRDVLRRADLEYYWDVALPLLEDERVREMVLLDENLYCLTNENRLWAVEAASGVVKWYKRIAGRDQTVFRPCHADNMVLPEKVSGIQQIMGQAPEITSEPFDAVLINTLSRVLVFDRDTGDKKRDIAFEFPANTGGACDGEFFYVASTKGWCHAIRLASALPVWAVSTAGLVSAPVEYHGGHVYIASRDRSVYAAQAGPLNNVVWRRELPAPIITGFAVDDRGCFVPCQDNRIYALDPMTGEPLWEAFITEGHLLQPIQVSQRSLFQKAEVDKFYAINLANGRLRWTRPDGKLVLAVMNGEVYLLDANGLLEVVNEVLGEVRATLPLVGMELFAANTSVPAIYAGDRQGRLFCIRPINAEPLSSDLLQTAGQ